MTGTALHRNEIFQYLVLDKIVIAFTAKKIPDSVCVISTWISVIHMRICNVLLNFFVSVYMEFKIITAVCGSMAMRSKGPSTPSFTCYMQKYSYFFWAWVRIQGKTIYFYTL